MKNSRDSVEPRQPPVLPFTVRTLYAMAELYCPPPPGHLRQTQPSPLLLVSKLGLVVCWLSSLATQAEIVLSFPVEAYAVAAHGCCGFGPEGQTIGTIVEVGSMCDFTPVKCEFTYRTTICSITRPLFT